MSEDTEQSVALRRHSRRMSDHIPRIVDLSLLTIQNREAVVGGGSPRLSVSSPGADDVLTPADVADAADVPGSADGAREGCAKADDEDGVLLRYGDENKNPEKGTRSRSGSSARPRKMSSLADHNTRRLSVSVKRHSEPHDLFWPVVETEQLVKRHSGTEGVLRRRSSAVDDFPRRVTSSDPPLKSYSSRPVSVDLPLKRRGERGGSSDSDSSDASFHTAHQSPMCEAPPKVPRVTKTPEPTRARQPQHDLKPEKQERNQERGPDSKRQPGLKSESEQMLKPGSRSKSKSESESRKDQDWKQRQDQDGKQGQEMRQDQDPEPSRQRADSWRVAAGRYGAVSVRARIGQIERELGVLARRPGGAATESARVRTGTSHNGVTRVTADALLFSTCGVNTKIQMFLQNSKLF